MIAWLSGIWGSVLSIIGGWTACSLPRKRSELKNWSHQCQYHSILKAFHFPSVNQFYQLHWNTEKQSIWNSPLVSPNNTDQVGTSYRYQYYLGRPMGYFRWFVFQYFYVTDRIDRNIILFQRNTSSAEEYHKCQYHGILNLPFIETANHRSLF